MSRRIRGPLDSTVKKENLDNRAIKVAQQVQRHEYKSKQEIADDLGSGWTEYKVGRAIKHSIDIENSSVIPVFWHKGFYKVLKSPEDAEMLLESIDQIERMKGGLTRSQLNLRDQAAKLTSNRSRIVREIEEKILLPGESYADLSKEERKLAKEMLENG